MRSLSAKPGSLLRKEHHAHLDIGSSQTICLIAGAGADGTLQITGVGSRETRGINACGVTDINALVATIDEVVSVAERGTGERVFKVVVGFNIGRPQNHFRRIPVKLGPHSLSRNDIAGAMQDAELLWQQEAEAHGRRLILAEPVVYDGDGVISSEIPIGLYIKKLAVYGHGITVDDRTLRNLELAISRSRLSLGLAVPGGYAAGLAVLVDDERRLGAAVVDLGAGCRDICLYIHGVPVFAATLPGGGDLITHDIAATFDISFPLAEKIKILHGNAMPDYYAYLPDVSVVETGNEQTVAIPHRVLNGLVVARLKSLLGEVRTLLQREGFYDHPEGSVVLTGGVSMTSGLLPLAEGILGVNVRTAEPVAPPGLSAVVGLPAYANAVGLVLFAAGWSGQRMGLRQFFDRLFDWSKNWFKQVGVV